MVITISPTEKKVHRAQAPLKVPKTQPLVSAIPLKLRPGINMVQPVLQQKSRVDSTSIPVYDEGPKPIHPQREKISEYFPLKN